MRLKILGSSAGGGLPQWNCACANCSAVRSGAFQGKARTQTQVAISCEAIGQTSWFLLGASPDLRAQIESTPELQPSRGVRESPIQGAVLLNADLDHALGLLLLRELQPLQVYASPSIRKILNEQNTMFRMLQRTETQVRWNDFKPGEGFSLSDQGGQNTGIRCCAVSLGTHFPAYVRPSDQQELSSSEASLGVFITAPSGKRAAFFPAVPAVSDSLLEHLSEADVLLFDGTFWSDDELIRIQGSGQTAREMGHIPVSSPEGSLRRLAGLRRPRKIYIHINNTNPLLNEAGPEYRQVRDAGWEIAEDGWQFDL